MHNLVKQKFFVEIAPELWLIVFFPEKKSQVKSCVLHPLTQTRQKLEVFYNFMCL